MTLNAEKRKEKVRKNCEIFGKQENQKTGKIMQIRLTRIKKKEFKRNKAATCSTNLINASVFWKDLKSWGREKKYCK